MTIVLVTGTDTGVGKTWVARGVAHALSTAGQKVVAIKPVETGCTESGKDGEDGALLARATGQAAPTAALVRFAAPVAPAVAADAEACEIDFDSLVLEIASHTAGAETVLLEGAGGVLAPVTWDWNMMDLARELGASALVVASDRLGTINHTLLTLSALEFGGVEVLGVALTPPEQADRSSGGNARAIARLSGLTRVVTLPRQTDPTTVSKGVDKVVEWILAASDDGSLHL